MTLSRRFILVTVLLLPIALSVVSLHQVSAAEDTIVIRYTDVYFRPNQSARSGVVMPPSFLEDVNVLERSEDGHWVYVRCNTCGIGATSRIAIEGWIPKDATNLDRGGGESVFAQARGRIAVFTKPNEPYIHGHLPECNPLKILEISADGLWAYQSSEAFVIGWVRLSDVAVTQEERETLPCNQVNTTSHSFV